MDALKYVELAKCKDVTRYNLCSVYRAKNHLMATDGHRLHMSNGLPDAIPGYIDGLDGQFPDVENVIPKNESLGKIEFSRIGDELKDLRNLQKLVKPYDKKGQIVKLVLLPDQGLEVHYNSSKINARLTLDNLKLTGELGFTETGVNLGYLIDALSFGESGTGQIEFYGVLAPIKITGQSMGISGSVTAIVMPARLN